MYTQQIVIFINEQKGRYKMFDYFKKKAIENRVNDEILYEYVTEELEKNIKIKGLWAKAYANSDGNDNKIEPLYMQYRVQSIKDIFSSLEIIYNELSRQKLFDFISNGFKSDTILNANIIQKDYIFNEEVREQKKEQEATNLLLEKGYKPTKHKNFWSIKEPLGGTARMNTIEEYINYSESRNDLISKKDVKSNKNHIKRSIFESAENEEEAVTLLMKKGYKISKQSNYWKIKEPLGGNVKIDNLNKLIEYSISRDNYN